MSIEAAFVAHLLTIQPLTALVGSRIRPMRSNQKPISGAQAGMVDVGDEMPRITFQKISRPPGHGLTGAQTLANARIQIDVLGETYKQTKDVCEALRNGCDGYRGYMGDMFVDSCLLEDERDFDDASPGLDAAASDGVSIDFVFQHQEAQPTGVPALE